MPGGYQQTGNAYQGFAGGKYAYQQIVQEVIPAGGGGRLWPPMAMERALRKEEAHVNDVYVAQINIAAEKALEDLKVDKKRQSKPKFDDDDDDDSLLLLS